MQGHSCQALQPRFALLLSQVKRNPLPRRSGLLRKLESRCKLPQRHFQGVVFSKRPIVKTTLGVEELVFYFSGFSEVFSGTCGSGFCFLFQLWKPRAYV